jgi:hypothetical protein
VEKQAVNYRLPQQACERGMPCQLQKAVYTWFLVLTLLIPFLKGVHLFFFLSHNRLTHLEQHLDVFVNDIFLLHTMAKKIACYYISSSCCIHIYTFTLNITVFNATLSKLKVTLNITVFNALKTVILSVKVYI